MKIFPPLLFVMTSTIFANPCWATATQSPLQVCTEIHEARSDIPATPRLQLIWDLFRAKTFPASLVHTREIQLVVPDSMRVQPVPGSVASYGGYNAIFSIDPPADLLESPDLNAKKLRFAELNREINGLLPDLRSIAAASSIVRCVARAEKLGFDFDGFQKIAEERNSLRILDQLSEAEKADKIIARSMRKLKLNWQVVHFTDLMAVHRALSNPGLQNVVILSHGMTGGKLVDSRLNEYPLGFFSTLSPGVRSISIYACHGEEIIKTYHLENLMAVSLSEGDTRRIFVSAGTKLAGMEDLVPIGAFGSFMRHVDRSLSRVVEGVPMGPLESNAQSCSTQFSGLKITNGTLGFALNGTFIGSVNAGNQDFRLKYPCELANRDRNLLVIHGINLLSRSTIESTDFSVMPVHPGKRVVEPSLTQYRRADGSYQGSLYEFGLE